MSGLRQVQVSVRDGEFPNLSGEFGYLLARNWVALIAVGVQPSPGLPRGVFDPLTVTAVRDLPLARWEAAARAHVHPQPAPLTPADARQMRGQLHLQQIAQRFERERRNGTPDPAAAIAREDGVNRSTVRSWIHRARKLGLLPPVQPGPDRKGAK